MEVWENESIISAIISVNRQFSHIRENDLRKQQDPEWAIELKDLKNTTIRGESTGICGNVTGYVGIKRLPKDKAAKLAKKLNPLA